MVGERYNSLPFSVVIDFVISLWPNQSELRYQILGVGTEFHHLSHHVDEFSVNHVTMAWQSMNHSVTQVWHYQQGAPLNCNALGKCWFLQNEMEKILKFGGNVIQLVVYAMTKEKMLNVWTIIGLQKKLSAYLILRKK